MHEQHGGFSIPLPASFCDQEVKNLKNHSQISSLPFRLLFEHLRKQPRSQGPLYSYLEKVETRLVRSWTTDRHCGIVFSRVSPWKKCVQGVLDR